jgi:hypothetical protein
LYSEVSPTLEIFISLPPKESVLYRGRKPQLRITVADDSQPDSAIHEIAIRSDLEAQIMQLLNTCRLENAETRQHKQIAAQNRGMGPPKELSDEDRLERQRVVDEIVAFVQSQEYVELNA